jgi:hypothetical protein
MLTLDRLPMVSNNHRMMIDADVLEAAVAIGCLVGALAPLAGIAGVIVVDVRRDRRRARR